MEDVALKALLEGTARVTGERFFDSLVENLAKALHTHGAWVTEYVPERKRFRILAFWADGHKLRDYEMDIEGTPCEVVIRDLRLVHYPDGVQQMYGANRDVREMGTVSYMGVPLLDCDQSVLGHMAVLDRQPMPERPWFQATFEIFAARAAAELQRLRAEASVREREEKLSRLVESAMDAIVELDYELNIRGLNSAAERIFSIASKEIIGSNLMKHLTADACRKLTSLVHDLQSRPEGEQYVWIPGDFEAIQSSGKTFPAEASLSRYQIQNETHFTLILRNVNDRLEAAQKIQSLSEEAEYLREEIRTLQNFEELVGESTALLETLREVQQVSKTETTVLILGETGTGKELIARAIHSGSSRKDKPLIKVNCAAIPPTLMESEFFGHEAGAFTGATRRREGRFELANDGTIFLDEIGELSVDLQAKLLRVLQEGEFEPVGSSRTKKVNVRVLAATNQNLQNLVSEGKFREDLYYRIHVFPVHVPALRDRGNDVILLAQSFVEHLGRKIGRKIKPLTSENIFALKSYNWPGNVRELQNVIERAIITSIDGTLNRTRALPQSSSEDSTQNKIETSTARVMTAAEIEDLERQNLVRALEKTGWRISGQNGAAQLLGLKPTTLTSRMKALGIQRPRPS